jgi:hypothetical protein
MPTMGWLEKFKRVIGQDTDGELGRADLVALASRGILSLGRRDERGKLVYPPGVVLRVTACDRSLETLRAWARDPATEAEVSARLLNEGIAAGDQPVRRWEVERGEEDRVEVIEDASPVYAVLVVSGGDRDGDRFPVGAGAREWRIGRGRWHADNRLQNDIVLSDAATWLSRAAAVLRRTPGGFELESRDQGEYVAVHPRDGTPRRPAMSASGRVAVAIGDHVEFHDGNAARLLLRVEAP